MPNMSKLMLFGFVSVVSAFTGRHLRSQDVHSPPDVVDPLGAFLDQEWDQYNKTAMSQENGTTIAVYSMNTEVGWEDGDTVDLVNGKQWALRLDQYDAMLLQVLIRSDNAQCIPKLKCGSQDLTPGTHDALCAVNTIDERANVHEYLVLANPGHRDILNKLQDPIQLSRSNECKNDIIQVTKHLAYHEEKFNNNK